MRIIDKNHDFYDYLQEPTDTIVFDRRNSYLLTKEMVCEKLTFSPHPHDNCAYRTVLLQCGVSFWLILIKIMQFKKVHAGVQSIADCSMKLLEYWKNYKKERTIISLQEISFPNSYRIYKGYNETDDDVCNRIKKSSEMLRYAIDRNEHKTDISMDTHDVYTDHKSRLNKKTYDIPLLKACGICNIVEPIGIFCAIEEYFSMKKTAAETTEAKGATNDDKIIMHGFDTKTSFRGEQKE